MQKSAELLTLSRGLEQRFMDQSLCQRRSRFTVNRSPHIDKESREQFEIRTFRRNMVINPSEQTIDALMKLELASGVEVEIKVLEGGKA